MDFHYLIKILRFYFGISSGGLRTRSVVLFGLMIIGAFFEVISISLVLPFIAVLASPELLYEYLPQSLRTTLVLIDQNQLAIIITICSIIAVVIAGAFRFFLAFFQLRLAYDFGSELRKLLFDKTLRQELIFFEIHGPSSLVSQVHDKVEGVVHHFIIPVINITFSLVVLIIAFVICLNVAPESTIFFALSLFLAYSAILFFSRKVSRKLSNTINSLLPNLILYLRDSYCAVRQILLSKNYSEFVDRYTKDEKKLKDANLYLHILAISPKFFIETIVIIIALSFSFYLSKGENDFVNYIPIFGAAVLAFQRLFPIIQQMYAGISSLRGSLEMAVSVQQYFEIADNNLKIFQENLEVSKASVFSFGLDRVSFSYVKNSAPVLDNVSQEFVLGRHYGIIGKSGSGKSTFVDCLMGLLRPDEGCLTCDGVALSNNDLFAWRRNIAHVPQEVFLLNSDIECNVAFTFDKNVIDQKKVEWAIRLACLEQEIAMMPSGINTNLGENGATLSGGQKQRIGLARAFYLNRPILVLDEATSALDMGTESIIMKNLRDNFKETTIISISHRLHSLQNCDFVLEIENGKVSKELSYPEFIKDMI